jgi:hypothetical protein
MPGLERALLAVQERVLGGLRDALPLADLLHDDFIWPSLAETPAAASR